MHIIETSKGGIYMYKKNFYVGLGVGMAAFGLVSMVVRPRRRRNKCAVSKALMSLSELADSINDNMPW